jgi:hypothetical protein
VAAARASGSTQPYIPLIEWVMIKTEFTANPCDFRFSRPGTLVVGIVDLVCYHIGCVRRYVCADGAGHQTAFGILKRRKRRIIMMGVGLSVILLFGLTAATV